MTVTLVYQIHCDICGERYSKPHRFAGAARYDARAEGWTSRLVKDGRDERCEDRCARCSAGGTVAKGCPIAAHADDCDCDGRAGDR